MNDERRDFLPPEPAGPEPELGPGPAPQAPPPPAYPPPQQPPPPGYPAYGWQQQQQQQQQAPPPGWGYPPPPEPDNSPAVTGFVLSLVSAGLLFFSGGISSIVSIGCSIAAIVVSRKGKAKVERGETQKNKGLAQAGFVIGIVGLVLAVLATLVWALIIVAAVTDDEFRRDLEDEFDNPDSVTALVRVAATGVRLLLG